MFIAACSREPAIPGSHLVSIESKSAASNLFYSGTVQPIKTVVVPSPADGAVVDMQFQYGEEVKSGQVLFMISSTKFLTDYKTALMQYIKAKSEFNTGQSQFSEAEFLHKNQLISDDDFKTKKSTFYGSQLALIQAKDALEILIKQLNLKGLDLYKLTIADIDKITQAMHLQMNSENLQIIAPQAGIVLGAIKNEDENNKKINKGDTVKQGDVLAILGDMNGLSVRIKVNELIVNQLKLGQKVIVTGMAFPDDVLDGEIRKIDKQAEVANGGLPTFAVEIVVPKLTPSQQKIIHVGMSANIEINIKDESHIMVPINALIEKSGESYLKIYDKNSGIREVLVKTGKTTIDSVVILAGIKSGDKIVVPN